MSLLIVILIYLKIIYFYFFKKSLKQDKTRLKSRIELLNQRIQNDMVKFKKYHELIFLSYQPKYCMGKDNTLCAHSKAMSWR